MKKSILYILFQGLLVLVTAQIPVAGNVLWLKADAGVYKDASGTPAANGDLVQVWADQSGNGNHFAQATPIQRPVLLTSILCAGNVLHFNAGNKTYLASAMTMGGPKTVFIVFRIHGIPANTVYSFFSLQGAPGDFTEIFATSNATYRPIDFISDLQAGQIANGVGLNTGFSATGNMAGMVYNGGGSSNTAAYNIHYDCSAPPVTASNLVGRLAGDATTIGGRAPQQNLYFLEGDIAEIIVYNRALTMTESAQVETYLIGKYGVCGTCTVLALQWLWFDIKTINNTIKATWKTTGEPAIVLYRVEYSRDGLLWKAADSVKASGNGSLNEYTVYFAAPEQGIRFYRIRAVNAQAGVDAISSIRNIAASEQSMQIHVFPNPAVSSVSIKCPGCGIITLTITDVAGKKIKQQLVSDGQRIDWYDLAPGIYYINAACGRLYATTKMIKPA